MCDWAVRADKAGRQDWESNYQHYSDIGPISFFFFFFFFKIWYLAENKREKIAFPKFILQAPLDVYLRDCPVNSSKNSPVISDIIGKFAWVFQKLFI